MAESRIWFRVCLLTALTALLALGLDRMFPVSPVSRSRSVVVTASDGTPLRAFADDTGVWRHPVGPGQVSDLYLQALLTYEDRWFRYHPGVNPLAMVRGALQNLRAGRVISGGSTLTMQTARILFPVPGAGPRTAKLIQMLRALQMEAALSKDRILGLYLSHAPFGGNIEGVWAASRTFLGKDPVHLTHAEAALLAVLPQAPSFYRPDRHPDRARKARDKVLDRMARFGVWPEDVVADARMEPVVASRFHQPLTAPLAARRVVRQDKERGRDVIRTLLDYDLQVHVEALVRTYLSGFREYLSAAVLIMDHRSLSVRAYLGSAEFLSRERYGHVDMVRAVRSPGSALKPFLYGMAMDAGLVHSHSLLQDIPRYTRTYMPGNFSRGFSGPVSLEKALQESLNVPAVQVLEALGPQVFHDRLRNGGARLVFAGPANLSLVLGGAGTDMESLVTLYAALARGGQTGRPRLVPEDPVRERYLMSPAAAGIVRQILSHPLPGEAGLHQVSGRAPVAWKTGTSYGFRDAWAFGISGHYVAGVWVGRPDGTASPGRSGAVTALPLLARVLESLPQGQTGDPMPETVVRDTICWPSGLPQSLDSRDACPVRHEAWRIRGQTPRTLNLPGQGPLVRTFWVDDQGRRATPVCGGIRKVTVSLWPRGVSPWLPAAWRQDQQIPRPSAACPDLAPVSRNPVSIISIGHQGVLTRQPGPGDAPRIPLQAMGGEGLMYWFLNRVPLGAVTRMELPGPGIHELAVLDEAGNHDIISFRVIGSPSGSIRADRQ